MLLNFCVFIHVFLCFLASPFEMLEKKKHGNDHTDVL